MKVQLVLLVMALLVGFVTADAGSAFRKLSKAYMAHKDPGEMRPEMTQDQPEMMAEEEKMMELPMMDQSPPPMEYARDNRYNPLFGHYYMKLVPYGYDPGMYPYGGVVYVDEQMGMDMNNAMDANMQRYPHPNVVA